MRIIKLDENILDKLDPMEVQQRIQNEMIKLADRLRSVLPSITMDELCQAKKVYPVIEFCIPAYRLYYFTLSGKSKAGDRWDNVLMAGHGMQVLADNLVMAANLAKEGLEKTVQLGNEFAAMEHFGITPPLNHNEGVEASVLLREPTKH